MPHAMPEIAVVQVLSEYCAPVGTFGLLLQALTIDGALELIRTFKHPSA